MKPGFEQDWFGVPSQVTLARLARSVSHLPGLIIEFGSWEGRSTVALANAVYPAGVCAVDTWQGSPDELSGPLAAERDIHAQFLANIEAMTKGNVVPFRSDWRDFVPTIDEPVAFCFIDAEHSYKEVKDNIDAMLPLMTPGGIMCGDDNHHPPVRQALIDTFGNEVVGFEATLWIYQVPRAGSTGPRRRWG